MVKIRLKNKLLIYIFCGLCIFSVSLFSQNIEVDTTDFDFIYNIPLNISNFRQDRFLLGFQWSGTGYMHDALFMNARADNKASGVGWDSAKYGCPYIHSDSGKVKLIVQPGKKASGWDVAYIRNAASMQYEPGMLIDTTDPSAYLDFSEEYEYDDMDPVFGFRNIDSRAINTYYPSDHRYRLVLQASNFSNIPDTGIRVLADPWPDDQLLTFQGVGQLASYDGTHWNLSINLRSLGSNTGNPNDTILMIKMPYTMRGDTVQNLNTIKFIEKTLVLNTLNTTRGQVCDYIYIYP